MATLDDLDSVEKAADPAGPPTGPIDLLVAVAGPVSDEEFRAGTALLLDGLTEAWTSMGTRTKVAFAYPVASTVEAGNLAPSTGAGPQMLSYPLPAAAMPSLPWMAAPAAYRGIAKLAEKTGARACIVLSQDLAALDRAGIQTLARPLIDGKAFLTMPIYPTGKYDGLLNSSVLYPFTRALYGKQVRYPLATDFGIGGAMISRLASEPSRGAAESIVWPAVESALADGPITQVYVNTTHSSQHEGIDLSAVLGKLGGALFEDAEKNAALWQRLRGSQPTPIAGTMVPAADPAEDVNVRPLIESFNLGLRNLQDIWGLVLPPVTLLELKRMARLPVEEFRMADTLWAKIVYDFALAHRLRTISRTHLLGALTPLYLGWVASYAAEVKAGNAGFAEQRIERLAKAYEEAKSYFVSRWRWPDRFNP